MNILLVLFTGLLVAVATIQVCVYRQMRDHTKQIERAYVVVCHKPEGLHPDLNDPRRGLYTVRMEIKNCGETPAQVRHGALRLVPDLAQHQERFSEIQTDKIIPGGFLVRNKKYFASLVFDLTPKQRTQLNAGQMWLVGWIWYTDAFGTHHRSGYARHVEPSVNEGNNLSWDGPSTGHNYDEEVDDQGNPIT